MPNILRRPMFKLGGSSSDGVGITSGFRKGYAYGPDYSEIFEEVKSNPNMTSGDYTAMMTKMLPGIMSSMQGAGKLDNYELAMMISDVAGKGGSISDMVTNMTTSITPFVDRYKKAQASMGPAAFNMLGTMGGLKAKSEQANRPLLPEVKTRMLDELAQWKTTKLDETGGWKNNDDFVEWQARMNVIDNGFVTDNEARVEAAKIVSKLEEFEEAGSSKKNKILKAWIEFLTGRSESVNYAQGGRVGRNIGGSMQTNMVAENIQTPGGDMEIAASETMEAPTPSQDPYMLLRARLPREITDDVVRLIATNPEAFKDFAAIETQEDVIDFNATYGVELVLPAQQV
jgi:hypothetical protein